MTIKPGFVLFCVLLPAVVMASKDAPLTETPAQSVNEPAPPADDSRRNDKMPLPRGQLLYENHCRKCHESQIHIRDNRKSKSIDDVRGWVTKWQADQKLGWQEGEILDVTRYLVGRFYRFK